MRRLSDEFMTDLKEGFLYPILEAVQTEIDFILEIREDCIEIFYKGGRILELKRQRENEYIADFNIEDRTKGIPKCAEPEKSLKDFNKKITTMEEAKALVKNIRSFKDIMDYHFSNSENETFERYIQQLIVQENNLSRISNDTDYFIVDFEYKYKDDTVDTRFDLIALFWDRRRRQKVNCRLAIMEVKYGDVSLKDKNKNQKDGSDLIGHIKKTEKFLEDETRVREFRKEMFTIFKQKCDLDIFDLDPKEKNKEKVKNIKKEEIDEKIDTIIDPTIDFIFILAGHNPGSDTLKEELEKIKPEIENTTKPLTKANTKFAASSFAGYALFKENIKSFDEFMKLL